MHTLSHLKHLHLKHMKKFLSQSPAPHICPVHSVAVTTWTWSCKDNAGRFLTVLVWGLVSLVIETAVNIQNIAVSHCSRKHCWIRPKRAFGIGWMDTNKALSMLKHCVFRARSVSMSRGLKKEKKRDYILLVIKCRSHSHNVRKRKAGEQHLLRVQIQLFFYPELSHRALNIIVMRNTMHRVSVCHGKESGDFRVGLERALCFLSAHFNFSSLPCWQRENKGGHRGCWTLKINKRTIAVVFYVSNTIHVFSFKLQFLNILPYYNSVYKTTKLQH